MKRFYLFLIMCLFVQVSNSQQAVDLGLSVKWATCNVGASFPEDYGDYYAWGETETKDDYSIENYKWRKGSDGTFTKYYIFRSIPVQYSGAVVSSQKG